MLAITAGEEEVRRHDSEVARLEEQLAIQDGHRVLALLMLSTPGVLLMLSTPGVVFLAASRHAHLYLCVCLSLRLSLSLCVCVCVCVCVSMSMSGITSHDELCVALRKSSHDDSDNEYVVCSALQMPSPLTPYML